MAQRLRDDFPSTTRNDGLVTDLRDRIRASGPLTFRDFMQAVLYDPRHGYYVTHADEPRRAGDYVTSPQVHPAFGALVARQLAEMWNVMSRPPRFDVLEQGAGGGLLARDILRWARRAEPEFADAMAYGIVEPIPAQRAVQERTLGAFSAGIEWHVALSQHMQGVVLSNELVDAFPVHRVVRRGDDLREIYVTERDGRFDDVEGALSKERLHAYFDDLGLLPGDGCSAEVNLDAVGWIRDVASSIDRGYVLTFDYGYEAADLYAPWRRDGTLLCFYRQSASSDPYARIGEQDITASVDFTTLRRAGEAAGLRTLGCTDQASFLVRMGIGDGLASSAEDGEMEEYFARREAVMALLDPARLGRITVLLQGKGVPDAPLRGFHDGG
jgi:SAM-dependent MidA family methyltransferase